MAAAFSSAAIVFNKSDSAYSQQLLSAASSLYVQVRGLKCIHCTECAWHDHHSYLSAWAGPDSKRNSDSERITCQITLPAASPDSSALGLYAGMPDRLP